MDVNRLIDAQFRRAVEIVQGLPKTGPIQTGYEEKLAMYSLYKQATVGNVKTPRPGIWDMLGRAKWDAWAKHKDLPQHEAKWLYVETLLKVLRKYSSQTVAMDLVRELESFQGDPNNLVLSGSYMSSRRRSSSDSGESSDSDDHPNMPQPFAPQPVPAHLLNNQRQPPFMHSAATDDDTDGEPGPVTRRPVSSLSSAHRYRTPMATSTGVPAAFSPPPPPPSIPEAQPMPRYAASTAFSPTLESMPTGSLPSSSYPTSMQYPPTGMSRSSGAPTPTSYPSVSLLRGSPMAPPGAHYPHPLVARPDAYLMLEEAVQKVQASLAALHERLDVLEAGGRARIQQGRLLSSSSLEDGAGGGGGADDARWRWDAQRYGAWALVLDPLTRIVRGARAVLADEHASPVLLIVRRLLLDASFVVFVLWVFRQAWRRSGARKRQLAALVRGVFFFVTGGERPRRVMVDRGV